MILWFREGLPGVPGGKAGSRRSSWFLHRRWCGRRGERGSRVPRRELEEQQGPWLPPFHVGLRDWRLRLTSWKSLLQSPVCWLVPCTRREMMPDASYIQEVCFQMLFRFWINLFCVRSEPCALGRFLCLCDGRGISSSWVGGQWRETQLVCPMNGFFFSYPVGGCCELCMQNELVLWHSSPAGSRCSGPCCFSPSSWVPACIPGDFPPAWDASLGDICLLLQHTVICTFIRKRDARELSLTLTF